VKRLIVTLRNFARAPERPFKSLSVPTYDKFLGSRSTKHTKLIDRILDFFQRNYEEEWQPIP